MTTPRHRSSLGNWRIDKHGAIGNTRSAALVNLDGTIDWCCLPRFDSPSVFAAILDQRRGGLLAVSPTYPSDPTQAYVPRTNVLETAFDTKTGRGVLTDFMPCSILKEKLRAPAQIFRQVRCDRGIVRFRADFQPRLGYGQTKTRVRLARHGCVAYTIHDRISLSTDLNFVQEGDGRAVSEFMLGKGEDAWLVISHGRQSPSRADARQCQEELVKTVAFWEEWSGGVRYQGPWRDAVLRSALALKLLQYSPTGEMVAAVTTSIPEEKGGTRNWDYRYSWVRDSSYALSALARLGLAEEATKYVEWLVSNNESSSRTLPVMEGIQKATDLTERQIKGLEGYAKSLPIRIGNAAARQFQLDTYGFAMDLVAFIYQEAGRLPGATYQKFVRPLADFVSKAWVRPDNGIWEIRQEERHYVTSKLMCAYALGRASWLARALGEDEDAARWGETEEAIKSNVSRRGWSESESIFPMYYGGRTSDASFLLVSSFGAIPPTDSRAKSTIERISRELSDGGMIRRYRLKDGLSGGEGVFTTCSFWMVNSLASLGRVDEARALFDSLCSKANHLGLYSEELDPDTGEALGNFPQGLVHASLINAAIAVSAASKAARRQSLSEAS